MAHHEYTFKDRWRMLKRMTKTELATRLQEAESLMMEIWNEVDTENPYEIKDYFDKHYPNKKQPRT